MTHGPVAALAQLALVASTAHGGFHWSWVWIPLAVIAGLVVLVLLIVFGVLTLLPAGIFAGVKGGINLGQSAKIKKRAQKKLDEASANLQAHHDSMQRRVEQFNLQKIKVVTGTIGGFADWMERNHLNVNRVAHDPGEAALIQTIQELPQSKMDSDELAHLAIQVSAGAAATGLAAAGTHAAALAAASAIGTASTGTAISSLSGAAATNASLAWLGRGALAAGGTGMAGGNVVLAVITVVPALAIAGFTTGILGSKAKTRGKRFAAEVDVACAQIEAAVSLRKAGTRRIDELSTALEELALRLNRATERLDSLDFDADLHVDLFSQAMLLVRHIREVTTVQVFDPQFGGLTEASSQLMSRYQ